MRTVRSILVTALSRWIAKGDPQYGEFKFVKLVHFVDGGRGGLESAVKVDSFGSETDISGLAEKIELAARNDAENAPGGIVETYGAVPYFGDQSSEGAVARFNVSATVLDPDDENSGIGRYTEGANSRGQVHQGMRHLEAMARTYIDGISRNESARDALLTRVMEENRQLAKLAGDMRNEVEEAKDRSMERNLTVFARVEEERRMTKIIDTVTPAAMALANAAIGRPVFPVDTEDAGILTFKSLLRGLTPREMQILSQLDPQKYEIIRMAVDQILKEDEEKERLREKESLIKVREVPKSQEAMEVLAKQDSQGIPRAPL